MDTADAIPVEKGVNILTHITQLYSARAQVAAHISSASLKEPSAGDYAWLYQVLHTHTPHRHTTPPPPPRRRELLVHYTVCPLAAFTRTPVVVL